jgi:ATP-dependent DNA helicase RecG
VLELSTPIKFVKRVGERVAEALAKRGVETVEDLLYHLPFRYEDRLNPLPIRDLKAGAMASIIGEVRGSALLRTRSMPIFEMTVGQGIDTVKCIWFHGSYLRDKFHAGQMVALYGKLESSRSTAGKFKMIQPQFEILPAADSPEAEFVSLEVGRIVPVYEFLGGTTAWGAKLTSRWLRRVVWGLLEELDQDNSSVPETLPRTLLDRLKLPGRLDALRTVHFPEAGTPISELMSASTPGHRRLIFEELF